METTRFRLRPGERVRTPRIVLLRYPGERMILGHNRFRQLLLAHYVQRRDGQPAAPPICHNTAGTIYRSNQPATEANQLAIIHKAAQLGVEAYWMDAYWYPQGWAENVGNWYPRPNDFPRGLRPLGDAAHRAGMKFVLWFEPERIAPATQFDREHPGFLLKADDAGQRLFDLGNAKARQFLVEFLDGRIKQWGVDVYRQDFNIDPLPFWRKHDAPDRRGVTEMLYVDGLYQLWSELLRRNPALTIDNCASGGRRIDLETCSLAYPLWRSDFNDIGEGLKGPAYWPSMARADQVHVTGLALYIPFQAGPLWDMHPYSVRSAMTSSVVLYERILPSEFPAELAKGAIAEVKRLRPFWLGDFYPVLPIGTSQAAWHAYQLDRPDLRQGCVLMFRRPESREPTQEVRLENIDPDAKYFVAITGETYEEAAARPMRGRELLPLRVRIQSRPGSALVRYTRITP
jgi:alpha-galactosidase